MFGPEAACYAFTRSSMCPPSSDPALISREEFEEFLHVFTHEIRNRLNGIGLEASDIAEQAGDAVDADRLQQRIRQCAVLLKNVRDLLSPEEPGVAELPLREVTALLRAKQIGGGN
jgi:signal transduction histidine kinase